MMEEEVAGEIIYEILRAHKSVNALKELIKIQCSNGNWDYDPYMHGMANGMILALSLFIDESPNFLNPPKQWLCDKNDDASPVTE